MDLQAREKKSTYNYDTTFYEYINKGSTRSANIVAPIVLQYFPIKSVIDFGCGQGAWLAVWKKLGVAEVVGVDGDYIDSNSLLINADEFTPKSLTEPVRLNQRFDLVESLEVAEHLPQKSAKDFVETLTMHGKLILFSAAVPGQAGENHINEQPYEYWRNLFRAQGYVLLDILRPVLKNNPDVEPWYKYNTFLYIEKKMFEESRDKLEKYRIADDAKIPDVSPILYKARKTLFRMLPNNIITLLAILKKNYIVRFAR
jgi:SAM-dependent methyltransferase